MALPSLAWLTRVGAIIVSMSPVLTMVVLATAAFYKFADSMLLRILAGSSELAQSIDTSAIGTVNFSIIAGVGYANAVFPLSEFLAIWSAVLAMCASVLVWRWVKSVIPFFSN